MPGWKQSSLPCESFDEQGAREDVRRTRARDGPFLDDVGFFPLGIHGTGTRILLVGSASF